MTLYRQLYAGLSAVFLALLVGLHLLHVSNARHFLEEQLASHAQDAATSIALSLGSRGSLANAALVETVIAPAFDRGYFRRIAITSAAGAPVAARELPADYGSVPAWFVRLLPLEARNGEAIISAGWSELGHVSVVSQPQYVYAQLWRTAVGTCAYLAAAYLLALVATRLFLRSLLHPLRAIEGMARALAARDFRRVDLEPRAPELRRVVGAMNALSGKLRTAIAEETERVERLCRQAREDALTGLYTRGAFEQEYETLVAGLDVHAVTLLLLDVDDIRQVNEAAGRARGDEVLACVAEALRAASPAVPAIRGRLAGTHFAVAAVNIGAAAASRLLEAVTTRVSACLAAEFPGLPVSFHCGGVQCEEAAPPLTALLASADLALARARSRGGGACELAKWGDMPRPPRGSLEWRRTIGAAIAADRYVLYAQPVLALPGHALLHHEALVRQLDDEARVLTAAAFVPMAARHGFMPRIDAIVAEKLVHHLSRRVGAEQRVAVNIAPQTLADAAAVERVLGLLKANRAVASRLVFEMTEFGAARNPGAACEFAAEARALGAGFALDHFSIHRQGLALLPALLPEYVKLSASLTADLGARDTQFLMTSLARIAKPLDIRLIAQAVEDERALSRLVDLGIGGYQGHVSGLPILLAAAGEPPR